MSWRAAWWMSLVFCLTLLSQLPATWLAWGFGWSATGVSGSVWQGQAHRIGPIGPVDWYWHPWRLQAQASIAAQGQAWQVDLRGWPWAWQARIAPRQAPASMAGRYRLAGQWQGVIHMTGQGRRCSTAQGRISVADLALSAPWALGLGQGKIELDCRQGLHLLARLDLAGQHHANVNADLLARQAQLQVKLEEGAAITPLLRSTRLLAPAENELQRRLEW